MNNYKTYACVRISATIKIVKLAIKTLHLIVVAHIRSQTTLRWRPKGSGILPKRTSALREVGLTSRVLDDVGGHADGGVDRRSRKPRNNFYKRSHIGFFSIWHAYLYYGISVKRMHTQGVRIHSTPRIHSFSKWGGEGSRSGPLLFWSGLWSGSESFLFQCPLTTPFILNFGNTFRKSFNFESQKFQMSTFASMKLILHSWIWQKPMYQHKKGHFWFDLLEKDWN